MLLKHVNWDQLGDHKVLEKLVTCIVNPENTMLLCLMILTCGALKNSQRKLMLTDKIGSWVYRYKNNQYCNFFYLWPCPSLWDHYVWSSHPYTRRRCNACALFCLRHSHSVTSPLVVLWYPKSHSVTSPLVVLWYRKRIYAVSENEKI